MRYALPGFFLLIPTSLVCATSALATGSTIYPSRNHSSSLAKTRIICLDRTPSTTAASANAFIEDLLTEPWVYVPTTWSQRIETTPGHLPFGLSKAGTELTMYAKDGTMEEDTLVFADWVPVLRNIVKECIARDLTGGRAFVGEKGFLGWALMGAVP